MLGDYAKNGMRTYPVRLLDAIAELPAGRRIRAPLWDADRALQCAPDRAAPVACRGRAAALAASPERRGSR